MWSRRGVPVTTRASVLDTVKSDEVDTGRREYRVTVIKSQTHYRALNNVGCLSWHRRSHVTESANVEVATSAYIVDMLVEGQSLVKRNSETWCVSRGQLVPLRRLLRCVERLTASLTDGVSTSGIPLKCEIVVKQPIVDIGRTSRQLSWGMDAVVDVEDDVQLYVISLELDAVLGDDVAERWDKERK